jgi:16S rRNA (uracil1498-N3)-methyltransferase
VAHVFVADVGAPTLAEADRHHLERVLRLRPGERVTVSDGAGGWRVCVVGPGLALEPDGDVVRTERPRPELTVGFALVKGDRPEWIVQKLTECGVDRIVPFVAERSVVRWGGDKASRNAERLRRVAREAAMQSRRRWLPNVVDPVPFDVAVRLVEGVGGALADLGDDIDAPGARAAAGRPLSLDRPAVLVGPEGGWSDTERTCGLPAVRLGPQVLRAETAAVAAGVLLAALRDGVVAPVA